MVIRTGGGYMNLLILNLYRCILVDPCWLRDGGVRVIVGLEIGVGAGSVQQPKCGGDLWRNVGNSGCGGPSYLNIRGWNVNGSGCWGGGGLASASISLKLGIPSSSSSRSTLSRRCCIPVAKKMRHNKVHSPCFMELKAEVSIHFSLFVNSAHRSNNNDNQKIGIQ